MRLTDEQIMDIKEYLNRSIKITISSLIPRISKHGLDLIDTIEALQQENEQLRAKLGDWKYNAKCDADHIAALTADKDEQAGRLMRYDTALKQAKEVLQEAWDDDGSIAVGNRILETIKAIDALIGGKEDVK